MALAIAQHAAEERPLIADVVVDDAVAPALLEGLVAVHQPGEERLGLRGAEGRWGGVDAHPAAAGHQHLGPGVGISRPQDVVVAQPLAAEEAGGQPRGNALGAQEDGEGGGEVFAVSLLALEEEVGERIRMLSGKLHGVAEARAQRSEEHTSELQSREKLVCRLLLEKKNTT